MSYHEGRNTILMAGGADPNTTTPIASDLWEWTGAAWRLLDPAPPFPARRGHSMAFDPDRRRLLLVGGVLAGNVPAQDHWEFDGASWQARSIPGLPATVTNPALGFDHVERAMLFMNGGFPSPYFALRNAAPAQITTYAPGCPGSGGVPTIHTSSLPWIGSTFAGRLTGLPPTPGPAYLLLGTSRSQIGSVALPLDLTPAGMPGCTLNTDASASIAMFHPGTELPWHFPIPTDTAIVGTAAYLQWFLVDPAAGNPLGATMSSAMAVTAGAR